MPDNQDPKPEPTQEPNPDEQEKAFWDKFEGHLDTWFDKKIEKYRTTSPSRTGRTTLPDIFATMIFGPKKDLQVTRDCFC